DAPTVDAPDPCTPNPCQNGGTCTPGNGGPVCQCATGFEGPSCDKCALGHAGASCAACPSAKLTIQGCTQPDIDCARWIDGDNDTDTSDSCNGTTGSNCFATDIDFDLGSRKFVHRIRFLSDWWAKRPGTWELWASDDNANFSFVMEARSNRAPWKCVQSDPCTTEVPTECCPGDVTQDTSGVGAMYPKWDDFSFAGVTARHWRFRIKTTDDPDHLIMRELELYGHDCLGKLACATSSCSTGLCTGQDNAFCTCAGCLSPASCTSAFTGVAPACTTPTP
ncbi:MAG: calcium-binding EGF-like domain-containing protein, partial [Deltaproteobacteria bacterium]|nr:calcium-binding EGF-like domain-containing protein [Deltaproteobacteria bacterium]